MVHIFYGGGMKTHEKEAQLAVEKAIRAHHARGFPVYQIKDDYLIAIYPGGREVRLEKATLGLDGM